MDTGITEKAIPEFQGSIGALGTGLNANSDVRESSRNLNHNVRESSVDSNTSDREDITSSFRVTHS